MSSASSAIATPRSVELPSQDRQWRRRALALRNLPPVLGMLWHAGPWLVATTWLLRLLVAAIPIGMLTISRWIVDAVALGATGHAAPPQVWWWVAAECGLAALGAVLGRTIASLESLLSDRFSYTMSVRIMSHAAGLDLSDYEDADFQDRLERARAQATDRVRMVRATGDLLQQFMLLIGYAGSLLIFSPWLTLVLLASIVPVVIGESHFTFLGYTLGFSQTARRRELDYMRVLVSSAQPAKEVRAFHLADYLTRKFTMLWDGIYNENVAVTMTRWLWGSLLSLVFVTGYYGCYVWVVWHALHGGMTVGTMTLIVGAIAGASGNFQAVCATIAGLADEALFVTDLIVFFQHAPRRPPRTGRPVPSPLREGFRFENVSFHYPGAAAAAVDRLSFTIGRDERIALVGANGHGKSTIIKLLMRLYEPTEGRILLDGVDLREYSSESLADAIAPVFQDFMHYDMTARENIVLGRVQELASGRGDALIRQAAVSSLAEPVIERLPGQLDQMLGRRFEGGLDLSGGEWQKLALARAYLKNAQVLILDEPTAALDPRSEQEVFERLTALSQGRMTVLVSHRFSTVRLAERILVIEHGRIHEEGSHEALVSRGGTYASLFALQAASYR